jgi:hypothetical protein
MPNIAQDMLSQLDSKVNKLSICDIFKVFLGSNYERIIRIFKLYSPEQFSKGVWDDKLGEIQKILENQKYIINKLRRQQLTLQNSVPLANITQPLSTQLSLLNLENSPLQSQKRVNALNIPLQKPSITQLPETYINNNPLFRELASSTLTAVPTINQTKLPVGRLRPNRLAPFQIGDPSLSGGSKIKLRTFHFLEPKSYNEHAFRAEKPIIAGKMAYDFLRTHYKLKKGSSIMFTIEDRIKNKKYNYIGEKVNNKIIIKST